MATTMPFPLRSKRKELDEVAEDFSEFSLTEPPVKMRRLVPDVPVSIEPQEVTPPAMFEEMDIVQEQSSAAATNDDLALVLYKPLTIPGMESGVPSSASFVVDSNFIASIKNKNRLPSSDHSTRRAESGVRQEEEAGSDGIVTRVTDTSLAIVPWLPSVDSVCGSEHLFNEDQMDYVGEMEVDAMHMDFEEEMGMGIAGEAAPSGMESLSGLQQWQQQHCMYPNTPPNASAPLTWS